MKNEPIPLFNVEKKWEEEWKNMPEFDMRRVKPILTIHINFATEKDIAEFSKLLGQNITKGVKNYWYPKQNIKETSDLVYVDES